jgi:hypothetical protein
MGYVNESSQSPDRKFQPGTWDKSGFHPVWVDYPLRTTYKTQYGYRSGPLGPEEKKSLGLIGNITRSTMGKAIGALEAIDRAEFGYVDPWMVNRRDYTEFRARPTSFMTSCEYKTGSGPYIWNWARCQGAFGITSIASSSFTVQPSDASLQNWASSQVRAMRPTKPDFRLARFLGELRDANKMFRPDSYFLAFYSTSRTKVNKYRDPKVSRLGDIPYHAVDLSGAAGSASLNYQFAVLPTVSDIKKGAEAVLQSEKLVKQYLRDMNAYVRRTGVRVIDSKTFTGNAGWTTVSPFNITNFNIAGMQVSGIPGRIRNDQYASGLEGYLNTRLEQRVFSTYRYAPENAEHLLGVWDSYVAKAQKVLGLKLDLQTTWDLIPFSWMIDWFVDIGGMLGYQQDVADYKLVSKRAGYVLEWTGHGSVGLRQAGADDTSTRYKRNLGDGFATVVFKRQIRESGNPYGMSPDWNLNPFQWGILGSLGMAWLPNVPVFRRG